jgi:hypothetical protein
VNGCHECQERYRKLAQKLRDIAAALRKTRHVLDATASMIMRAVDNARAQKQRSIRTAQRGGGLSAFSGRRRRLQERRAATEDSGGGCVAGAGCRGSDDLKVPSDPWQSDELKDFGSVVQWNRGWIRNYDAANRHHTGSALRCWQRVHAQLPPGCGAVRRSSAAEPDGRAAGSAESIFRTAADLIDLKAEVDKSSSRCEASSIVRARSRGDSRIATHLSESAEGSLTAS